MLSAQPATRPAHAGTSLLLPRRVTHNRPRVLCLCTGGYCRSPLAAGLLSFHSGKLEVSCAGTTADHAGQEPALPTIVAVFERTGGPFTYTPHLVTRDEILKADLILCMAREHRDWIGKHYPDARARTLLFASMAGEGWDVPDPEVQSLDRIRPIAYLINQVLRHGVGTIETLALINHLKRAR
ncbi:MAG TPA: hypothetical protein VJG32_17845 [Anaerolineae bacterium]|nr:hypothetical protein [Anaerolineae bacterium]